MEASAVSAVAEIVLDSSVTLAWYFEDEADPYADAVARRFPEIRAVVSAIWPLEVGNALLVGERRSRSTRADTVRWTGMLVRLPITVEEGSPATAFQETLELARTQSLSTYDAAYLEVAIRRGLPLTTLDDRLRRAAAAVGVTLYQPG